jgi:hypothetical protein
VSRIAENFDKVNPAGFSDLMAARRLAGSLGFPSRTNREAIVQRAA